MISGWISYATIAFIGLALLGFFGDASNYVTLYGTVLIILFIWWILRRFGIIPAF